MPRKLPWLANTASKRSAAEDDAYLAKRRKVRTENGDENEPRLSPLPKGKARTSTCIQTQTSITRKSLKLLDRNSSSSPPPVPPTPE